MKPSGAIRYPVKGLTLHRVAVGQRSQGDGEEQTVSPTSSQEVSKDTPEMHAGTTVESAATKISTKPESYEGSPLCSNQQNATVKLTSNKDVQKNTSHDKYIPNIEDVAQKLTKVSIMSSPDAYLLNTPPKDMNAKIAYRLHPKTMTKYSLQASKEAPLHLQSHKRKEPRFVPYEPYKGCVKPIESKKISKPTAKGRNDKSDDKRDDKEVLVPETNHKHSAERISILVSEFEKEKVLWEKEKESLCKKNSLLQDQLNQTKKEKSNLESQLNVQSQVNTELKKLLVASVGEDVQGRVQCLTEDKARMATMIRRYSEKVDKDYEEKEKMGIQCDVWRSKFLGSSMLVDELASWKAILTQQLGEAQEAVRMLIDEHELARQHMLNTYKMNKQLREAFDPLAVNSGGIPPLTSADLVSLAVEGSVLAQTVRDHLCGPLGRSLGCSLNLDGLEVKTPGEKMAWQLAEKLCGIDGLKKMECGTVSPGAAAMLQRFHPNTRYEHVTVNCCGHCNGEIKVI